MVVGEQLVRVDPRRLPAGIGSSYPLPELPMSATNRAAKQDRSLWLGAEAYRLWEERRFRLLLTTPAIFPDGWRLPGVDAGGRWHFDGGSARLVAASHDRLQSVSGWDLAQRAPKPAVRAVPAGAVYWLDDLQGDPQSLLAQVAAGLPIEDATRRAEGFNNCLLARWPQHLQHPQRVD